METYPEMQQNLSTLLDRAGQEGELRILRDNGQFFVLKPEPPQHSPLDVPGVDLGISTQEIIEFIREGRNKSTPV